jgi:putative membrane protein
VALIADSLAIARADAAMLRRQPRLLLALLGVVLIPALYALIYLEAVWDTGNRTEALPAIIVNLDRGTEQHGRRIDLGADLVRTLQARRAFGFTVDDDEARARAAVRAGRSLFALIIPPDFSADAMRGNSPGEGRLVVFASEGNHYTGAGLARRFAAELGHQVNETLNERRWALVLGANAGSGDRLERFRSAIGQLREGARAQTEAVGRLAESSARLAEGADELAGGVGQLAEGSRRLGTTLRSLDAGRPAAPELEALKAASARQEAGELALARGLETLRGSAQVLSEGLGQLREAALAQPGAGETLAMRLDPPIGAAARLAEGLGSAADAQARLAQGSQALGRGVGALTDGMAALGNAIATLPAALPPEERLTALTEGGRALAEGTARAQAGLPALRDGAGRLESGLVLLEQSLPTGVETVDGTARGLAAPVEPDIQIDAPVRNDGTALVPPTIPVALWLGAVMVAFVFPLRTLPADAAGTSRLARVTGKAMLPVMVGLAQAAAVLLMATLLLRMPVAQPEGLVLSLAAASLAFVMITLAVVRALGDAGKALASILLIVQVSASGGIVPVELTSEFFRQINPWLPFTWVVRAVRASLFGAFDREWLAPLGMVLIAALIAFACAALIGRWRMVERQAYGPSIDL